MILGEVAVAGQGRELGEERLDIVLAMWPVGVAGNLAFAPGVEGLVEILEHVGGLAVERSRLLVDIHSLGLAGHRPQFFRLAFDLGEGLFELEVIHHPLRFGLGLYGLKEA